MSLFFRKIGENKPALIVLHGLYGSSDNWVSIGKQWSEEYEVYLLDLRNHGQSPHYQTHSYKTMRDDVLDLMDTQKIQKAIILGHSMGGKLAMRIAMDAPERINALIVVDIAPKNYTSQNNKNTLRHRHILKTMLSLKLEEFTTRNAIDEILQKAIPERRVRQFIMKNLKRNDDLSFSWKLNLPVIASAMKQMMQGFSETEIVTHLMGFPVLFIKGENSSYIQESDKKQIQEIFPLAEIKTISNAGHWIHSEQPKELTNLIMNFVS